VSLLPLIEDLDEVPGFVFNSGLIRPWWSFIYSAVTLVRSGWVSVAFPLLLAGVFHITDCRYFGCLDLLSRHKDK
jgi:hypothetical protein